MRRPSSLITPSFLEAFERLRMAEKQLNRPQILRPAIDQ